MDLARVDVALRVNRNLMEPVKFTGCTTASTEGVDDFHRIALQDPHLLVGSILLFMRV